MRSACRDRHYQPMQFNSMDFALFMAGVFALHWSVTRWGGKAQNLVLLISSVGFLGFADIRSLVLLAGAGAMNFFLAGRIAATQAERARTLWMRAGVVVNLALLGWFKYFDFFLAGILDLLRMMGLGGDAQVLGILLPLGISFYTFRMVGYLLAIHQEEITAEDDPLAFGTYVLFFPILLAGPIERAQRFLPQVKTTRKFDPALAADGLRQVLWGLVAKVVIADNASQAVDTIFLAPDGETASTLWIGAFLYFVQIYCDFSGYSNIAIGISKLLGIRIMVNFAMPFFSTNVSDFWRRWHISLTSWMMDHLFTPIHFVLRDRGRWGLIAAVSITFLSVGIWHGANWTFVVFGGLQSSFFLPLAIGNDVLRGSTLRTDVLLPTPKQLLLMIGTFLLMMCSFVLLRAPDLTSAVAYYHGMFGDGLLVKPRVFPTNIVLATLFFLLVEWVQRSREHGLVTTAWPIPTGVRWLIYLALLFTILLMSFTGNYQFIYFQF
ncbi:MAG: MBOAT family protein [Flavobacteriales bacterium]|nr:MBOAT family protein [Flavobacteriales bacterium]